MPEHPLPCAQNTPYTGTARVQVPSEEKFDPYFSTCVCLDPPPALPTFGVPYPAASVSGTRGVRCHTCVGFGVGILWGAVWDISHFTYGQTFKYSVIVAV